MDRTKLVLGDLYHHPSGIETIRRYRLVTWSLRYELLFVLMMWGKDLYSLACSEIAWPKW